LELIRYYAKLLDHLGLDYAVRNDILRIFFARYLILFILIGTITACMVGPNFRQPASPKVDSYTSKALPAKTASTKSVGKSGKAQHFVSGKDISSDWWTVYHSPEINMLVRTGLANSPNIASAYAALRQAQEAVNIQFGSALLPNFNLGILGQRQRFSNASIGNEGTTTPSTVFNLFNTSVNVSYTLDLFGAARRQLESLQAKVDYQQFQLIAAHISLTANIITTAVTIASLQAQIDATNELIKAQEDILHIIKKQFKLGAVSSGNVYTQETLVAQTIATLPPLEKQLSISRHALSVLVGSFPNGPLPVIRLNALNLPSKLPVSLPSRLVRQRPDVRASEALLHAASASIGVATANLFPQISLTGNYGWEAPAHPQLFNASSEVWSMASQITQPLFNGAALWATRRQAIDAYQQADAQYRQVVLQSFQNVADSLRALETDARALKADKEAELAAQKNFHLTSKQYRLGGSSYLNLLNAQQQYVTTKLARIQAQAARYNDTAALYQSLGGGWWHQKWCVQECV